MRRRLPAAAGAVAVAGSLALAAGGCGAPSPARVTAGMVRLADGFVYRADNPACRTTGTAFAAGGTIVTNRHVAAGAPVLKLSDSSGAGFPAAVVLLRAAADVARLDASASPRGAGVLASRDPPVGAAVWVAGYPFGDPLTVTRGRVVAVLPGDPAGGGPVLEVSDPVSPGNSGSPVLDRRGRVVGMVFAVNRANGDGLALPAAAVARALSSGRVPAGAGCAGG